MTTAASGRVWIEPDSGRVLQSEMWFDTRSVKEQVTLRARVRVTYSRDEHAAEFVPVMLQEEFEVGPVTLTGTATYSNFRRFTVETRTDIKRN